MLSKWQPRLLAYVCQAKEDFYCRAAVCQFVLEHGYVPLNPFMIFDYFLHDRVERDAIRAANASILRRCDEVWVFGIGIPDGVLAEIQFANELGKAVRLFSISSHVADIRSLEPWELIVDPNLCGPEWSRTKLIEAFLPKWTD